MGNTLPKENSLHNDVETLSQRSRHKKTDDMNQKEICRLSEVVPFWDLVLLVLRNRESTM